MVNIEIAAANMVWATKQPEYKESENSLPSWVKQAVWHNRGAFFDPKSERFPQHYVNMTWATSKAINRCDLLGIEGHYSCITES